MAWVEMVHDCPTPSTEEIRRAEAHKGSVWECDNCRTRWRLRQVRDHGAWMAEPRWDRAIPGPRTGAADAL
ncbi:MAG TPA: hypothetical protein VM677_27910 [Actinokineospora sp.]|jgi:hypothetical protein|nr:hypothetical protein [Actinokineospora sp.]